MNNESYGYYLQLLNLPRNASEKDIQASINKQLRIHTYQAGAAQELDKRQEAEKHIETLMKAEKVLLGAEGQIIRQKQKDQASSDSGQQPVFDVDVETVARAIERFAYSRGRKVQERHGNALYKRATIFYKGVEYLVEELMHKKYQANQDKKRCNATQEGLDLFEWYSQFTGTCIEGSVKTYLPGRWVEDLIAASAELDVENVGG